MKRKMRRNVRARVERKCHPPVRATSMEWTKEAKCADLEVCMDSSLGVSFL